MREACVGFALLGAWGLQEGRPLSCSLSRPPTPHAQQTPSLVCRRQSPRTVPESQTGGVG